ncbi:camphor resistance protein CrcB [Thermovirga lienii DSM 17291]|jgi:CrcB protein|uniref:Fluoride-specific ion channel FluC n=1 Tax=Thermovirga lienii (strain ATCC BAA-1197 / DSM 17291 / Cas60314) TaxID=580340 RepID=G7V718_THELD|nr:fluoride efflux transporter CrcB [Thermovirga lienii]MDN5318328.1 fluoride exporter [Thermovirga sp.]AER67207.1 camphor resistance protein CrcB [Thermovirga lienii DSM 17291]KUK43026.1 MAG: Protein CrcB-like protein [Thermovirga lienii]MDN5367851.1 fluoride exporter [Thermovirga sp.]HCD71400.1 fluoride efflux transporter CrcB [Thermovirga lienii]
MTLTFYQKILWLVIAGGIGALCRYGLSGAIQKNMTILFPMGTFMVNIIACFLAGALFTLFQEKLELAGEIRTIIFVGFFGAFSTFSTFMLETAQLLRDDQLTWAIANLLLQNGIGLLSMLCGIIVGKFI